MQDQANEPQGLMGEDPELQELSEAISDYIHGPAREQIAQALAQDEAPIDETISAMSYQILTQTAEQIHGEGEIVDMDLMFTLATETIDYLIEMAIAIGKLPEEPDGPGPNNEVREKSMIKLVQIHIGAVQDDPEQKALAEQMLAEFMQDGTYEEGMEFVREKVKQEGGDPAQMEAGAQQMMQPRPDPLASSVRSGLMGQGGQA